MKESEMRAVRETNENKIYEKINSVRRTECNEHHIMSNRINKQVNAGDYNARL